MLQCTRCSGFIDPDYGNGVELDRIDYVPGTSVIARVWCVGCAEAELIDEVLSPGYGDALVVGVSLK